MRKPKFYPQSIFFRVFCIALFLTTSLFSVSSLLNAASAAEVTLAWDANSEENLAGYKLYYKLNAGDAPYDGTGLYEGDSPVTIYLEDLENSSLPEFTLSGLDEGQLYFFALTAFDIDGLESDYSDEVSYEVPSTSASYTITATVEGQGGSITPEGTISAAEGTSQAFSIVADSNYSISDVIVDGSSVGVVSAYSFENINASHTIEAVFELDTFTVIATAGDGGTISPEGSTTADYSASLSYSITPDANFHISDVTVDGESVGQVSTYTFENITATHTIEAVFEQNIMVYTVSATAGDGGAISPAGSTTANSGATVSYSITPDANYHISGVKVDGVSVGKVSTYTFGNISASHTIEAVFEIDSYTVTAVAGEGGTISPAGSTTANSGATVSYSITPDANYHISGVKVDGVSVGKVSTYTFGNISASHTIEAVFEIDSYTVTAVAGDGGAISPAGSTTANFGEAVSYSITPDANYHISGVTVDGVSMGKVSTYTFGNISASHTIEAVFEIDSYAVTAVAGDGGTISPEGATTATYGASVSYTIEPLANYHIVKVLVDGSSVGQVSAYTFENINTSHTIEAVFELDTFTVTATAGANGTISPAGVVNAVYGSNLNYSITPAENYHVSNVMVDGASVGPVAAYTLENISASHTIQATFEINTLSITAVSGDGGTISPSGITAATYGSSLKYTITPGANYHISDVMVDGSSVGQVSAYTFENISVNHSIEAVFEIDTFTITAASGANGTISPAGVANAGFGSNVSYTITPAENYHIADVIVNGVSVGQVSTYTFNSISASHTIQAAFEIDTFSIVTSGGENGTVTPEGTTEIAFGANQVCTVTPNTGYVIEDVKVDGESVGPMEEYTFSNITADHTLEATFVEAIPGFAMEVGSVVVGDGWQQVSFERTFSDPVVVAATRNMDMIASLAIRINNVTETGFEISAVNDTSEEETIDYVVMEAGNFTLPDGTMMEAGTLITEDITGAGSYTFTGAFSEIPAAGASIVTCNNTEAVEATLESVSSTGFEYQLGGQDASAGGYLSEMVAYISMGQWQSPLSDDMTAAGITEEMMTITSEVISYSQPSANGIDTGTSGDDTGTTEEDAGTSGDDTGTTEEGSGSTEEGSGSTEENGGNEGVGNHPPVRPVPLSDMLEVSGVDSVVLSLEAFSDPDAEDYHVETEWQMFEVANETCIVSVSSTKALTEFDVPPIMLEQNTQYSWRARFMDNNGGVSEWSELAYVVTGVSDTDLNGNGIPDIQEADASVDLNRDGVPDVEQESIKSLVFPFSRKPISLAIEGSNPEAEIVSVEAVAVGKLKISSLHMRRARRLPYGLINFKLSVAEPGDTAMVRVYFSKPAPWYARWMKLDVVNDTWVDYSGYAQFSADRMSVLLEFVDGGYGDDDGVANGIIIDPAGLELEVADETSTTDTNVSDSEPVRAEQSGAGCFITCAAGGTSPAWPVVAGFLFLLFGAVLTRFCEWKSK